jgi:hypothetical protein
VMRIMKRNEGAAGSSHPPPAPHGNY